jgi:hypothetical protein
MSAVDLKEQIEHAAVHEAAHAVAATALDLEVVSVTIERTVDERAQNGWEIYRGLTRVILGDYPFRDAIVALAGPEASRRRRPDDAGVGMEGDRRAAELYIDEAAGDCRAFSISEYALRRAAISLQAKSGAADLVEAYWPQIQKVARALLDQTTLSGAEVVQLCGSVS